MAVHTSFRTAWTQLQYANEQELRPAFKSYVTLVRSHYLAGDITQEEYGLHLAKAMFLPQIDSDADCEAVAQYGGLLETQLSEPDAKRYRDEIDVILSEL